MKKIKFILALILCVVQFQCIHYFAKDTAEFNLTDEETKILHSKKFGIVWEVGTISIIQNSGIVIVDLTSSPTGSSKFILDEINLQ